MAGAELIRDELVKCGIEFIVWLPHGEACELSDTLFSCPSLTPVQVCHEEEAMGIYAGLCLGGRKATVLIQNTGFFHTIEGLRGAVINWKLPLLLIVGYRGYLGMMEGRKPFDTAAVYTEPVLDALRIKHYIVDGEEDIERISQAYRETMESSRPVAVLLGREFD